MKHKVKFLIACLVYSTSLCVGFQAEANRLTKEQIKEIEESNKRAFEAGKPKSQSLVAPSVDAEAENEVVTEQEFKAAQKKQEAVEKKKSAKIPMILDQT